MRARIPAQARLSSTSRRVIKEAAAPELDKQEMDRTRRLFKLFCLALNEQCGFGRERLSRVLASVSELSAEHDKDEVFWTHVDRVVIDQIGVQFDREDWE